MSYKIDDVNEKHLHKVIDSKTAKIKQGYHTDDKGNIRVEVGKEKCQLCGTFDKVLQLEMDTVKKGLPVTEIMFCCESCYKNKLKK